MTTVAERVAPAAAVRGGRVVHLTDEAAGWTASIWPILGFVGGWTAFVVVMASVVSTQKFVPFRYAFASEAVNYYSLALVSLVVWFASAALRSRRWPLGQQVVAHLIIGVVLIFAWQATYASYLRFVIGPSVWNRVFQGTWLFQLLNAVVFYGGIVAGVLALQSARRAREQERERHELALSAREAELRALTAQLEPHFLLNTLNSVMALLDDSPREARAMLERLGELLRATFEEIEEGEVRLGRELDLMTAYLEIEQVRFADRLTVSVDVPADLRQIAVPPFLLQPIVENAVKHGVAPFSGPGTVAIRAVHADGRVRIDVIDSGAGFDRQRASTRGKGLVLAQRRLEAFAPEGALHVSRDPQGRCVVSLSFPVPPDA